MDTSSLSFERDGAALFERALDAGALARLEELVAVGPGSRLHDPRLPGLIEAATNIAAGLIGPAARPVRAVLFNKTEAANWSVAWHQDRTIAVRERVEVDGYGPWSVKDGALHVAPPVAILQRMVTLRLHIDPCGPDNAPLRVALGSHRLGRVAAGDAAARAEEHPQVECLASAGDIWAYVTTILHASDRAKVPSHRRVLQLDYAADPLPGGMEWRGVG